MNPTSIAVPVWYVISPSPPISDHSHFLQEFDRESVCFIDPPLSKAVSPPDPHYCDGKMMSMFRGPEAS